ncbi:MAG: hypothetical protein ACRDVE_11030 [Actinocrinis sp.]
MIFTQIAITGDTYGGGDVRAPLGWTPPKCWLEPNAGLGMAAAYTPDDFGVYMAKLNALFHNSAETDLQYETNRIYYRGQGADPIVGLVNAPYNKTVTGGKWYMISCSLDSVYSDYTTFKASLGTTNEYEEWFWFNDAAPPKGIPFADPELLAELAAANTKVAPRWPDFSPPLRALQTVNLRTQITNPAGANGFRKYSVTARLQSVGLESTVNAYPKSVTFTSPQNEISPSSVTCYFNKDGSLKGDCGFTFLKSTSKGYTITESTTWDVIWDGDPVTGEAGWDRIIGPFNQNTDNVIVQEIQTIVGH